MNPHAKKMADGVRRIAPDPAGTPATAAPIVTASQQVRPELMGPFNLVVLQGWIIAAVRRIYAEPVSLFPGLSVHWSADTRPGTDRVWIGSSGEHVTTGAGFLPAVLVRLNDGELTGLAGGRNAARLGNDGSTQTTEYASTYKGTIQLVCLANGEGACLALVSNLLDAVKASADTIRDAFCFASFGVIGWATPRPDKADTAPDRYKGEVRIAYEYRDTWSLASEAPRIKVFDFRASLSGGNLVDPAIVVSI